MRSYRVIYDLVDEVRALMEGKLAPTEERSPSWARPRCARSSAPARASSPAAWSPRAPCAATRSPWCALPPTRSHCFTLSLEFYLLNIVLNPKRTKQR